jgi:hypothetical protein
MLPDCGSLPGYCKAQDDFSVKKGAEQFAEDRFRTILYVFRERSLAVGHLPTPDKLFVSGVSGRVV